VSPIRKRNLTTAQADFLNRFVHQISVLRIHWSWLFFLFPSGVEREDFLSSRIQSWFLKSRKIE